MTRIDFHSNVPDKVAYACRLVRKARGANCRMVMLAENRSQLTALDQALWTFSEHDFLPHVLAGDENADLTPILLTEDDAAELPHHDLLINLSARTPAAFARFERMIELVSAEDADKAAGRDRYRFYQQRGYPLTHFIAP
jgi:DNA polymerase-3 subunit chi